MTKKISIIIRTKNEERWISSCLTKVFNQTYKNIEVIIVDNCSTDKTIHKAREFDVQVINIDKFFPGKAINDGINASSGDIIVCLSGHCIPVNELWLENLIADLDDDNVAGVYGRQEPLSYSSDLDKRDLLTVFGLDKKTQIKDSFFHNANSAFKRQIWEKFPFEEEVTNIEDRIWGEEVIKAGLKIIYTPEASVFHWHGIHQEADLGRAKNIVKILESIDLKKNNEDKLFKAEDQKVVAIIPIKGESNLINEIPLLARAIDIAKNSKFVDDIIVSTDNLKTAKLAVKYGAKAPFIRPPNLSEPFIGMEKVLSFTLEKLEEKNNYYDIVLLLDENYPFRKVDLIDMMIERFIASGDDVLVPGYVEKRGFWIEQSGNIKQLDEDSFLPKKFKETRAIISLIGLCTIMHPSVIRNGDIFSKKVNIFKIDDFSSTLSCNDPNVIKLIKEKSL